MVGSSQWIRTVGVCVRAGAEGRTVCIILSDMPEGVAGERIQPMFHRYGCIVFINQLLSLLTQERMRSLCRFKSV